jgi:hypothetical protein
MFDEVCFIGICKMVEQYELTSCFSFSFINRSVLAILAYIFHSSFDVSSEPQDFSLFSMRDAFSCGILISYLYWRWHGIVNTKICPIITGQVRNQQPMARWRIACASPLLAIMASIVYGGKDRHERFDDFFTSNRGKTLVYRGTHDI